MKPKQMSAVMLGLVWLVSLGVVFVLGILSAFTLHLRPGASYQTRTDLTMEERDLALTIERYSGSPADFSQIQSITETEAVPEQLEQVLRAVLREQDPELRGLAALRLVRGLPPRRVLGAIRFLQETPQGPARDQLLARFLESWAGQDGRSAIGFAGSLPTVQERELAIRAVLKGWSRTRPSDAWNWVIERFGTSRRAERLLEIIFANLGHSDRDTAFMLLDKMTSEGFQREMTLVVMDQILQTYPPRDALNWLGQLPEATEGSAAAFLAGRWAQTEPQAAALWLSEGFPSELGGLLAVVGEWAYVDPGAAADWIWSEFRGSQRRQLMDVLAVEWLVNEGPTPLAEWLNAQTPDRTLDGAIEALAMATADLDPPTALVWAQSINDPDVRSMLEIMIGRQWIRVAPQEAAESLPLLLESESARAALLESNYQVIEDTDYEEVSAPFEQGSQPLQ